MKGICTHCISKQKREKFSFIFPPKDNYDALNSLVYFFSVTVLS